MSEEPLYALNDQRPQVQLLELPPALHRIGTHPPVMARFGTGSLQVFGSVSGKPSRVPRL